VTVTELTRKTMGREVLAKRDGTCRSCSRPIEAGDDYVAKVDGVGWMHALCAKAYCDVINEEADQVEDERGDRDERFRQICRELRDLDVPEAAIEMIERFARSDGRSA
jgi:hypothetical protein